MKRIAVLAALLGAGCGTVASVRALRPGQSTLAVTAGGPITKVSGKDIPLPYAVARYRYGAGDRLGLYAGAHVLMAAFGVAGLDAGATWKLVGQRGAVPEVGLGAGLVGLAEVGGGGLVLFPEASVTASWLWQHRFLSYAGVQGMMQASPDVYGAFAPFAGQEVRLWRGLSATLEAKWYAPNEPAAPRVIDFRAPVGGHGDIGVLLGLNWQFGGWYD
jgi:hypothetical protein